MFAARQTPFLLAGALAAALATAGQSNSECLRYSIQLTQPVGCPPPLGEYSIPLAVSEGGDLVGYGACSGGNDRAVAALAAGQVAPLNLPNTFWSRAYDINTTLEITGTMEVNGVGNRAFIYRNGQVTDLGWSVGHNWSEGYALNSFGTVVGFSANGPPMACRWIDGKVEMLSLPIGPGSTANDVNDNNQIVGWMGISPTPNFFATAFLWDNGNAVSLNMPARATNSSAQAISNSGIICGYYSYPHPNGPGDHAKRAVAWVDGQLVDLGVLPGFIESVARDVTDSGMIVGSCSNPPQIGGGTQAFVWLNGKMRSLDPLIVPGSAVYHMRHGRSINNLGQIAVEVGGPGFGNRAALLTPVPPGPGDTNCDWLVNVDDLLNIITAWGPYSGKGGSGTPDVNADGSVNVEDLLMIIVNWS